MSTLEILREFGWLGFLLLWLLDKAFPRLWVFLTEKLFPSRAKERERKLEELEQDARAKREAEASILRAKIERELRDEEHRNRIEERMVAAQEDTAKNIQQMTLAITVNNERLGQVIAIIDKLNSFTADAVADMRENVAKLHQRSSPADKRDTQPKMRAPRVKRQT